MIGATWLRSAIISTARFATWHFDTSASAAYHAPIQTAYSILCIASRFELDKCKTGWIACNPNTSQWAVVWKWIFQFIFTCMISQIANVHFRVAWVPWHTFTLWKWNTFYRLIDGKTLKISHIENWNQSNTKLVKFKCSMLTFVIVRHSMIKTNKNWNQFGKVSLTMFTRQRRQTVCAALKLNCVSHKLPWQRMFRWVFFWCVCEREQQWKKNGVQLQSNIRRHSIYFYCLSKLSFFSFFFFLFSVYAAMYAERWLLFNMKGYLAMRITYLSKRMKAKLNREYATKKRRRETKNQQQQQQQQWLTLSFFPHRMRK